MRSSYFLSGDGSFTIKNYNSAYPFSNFLPGVAGKWGIPLWAFYVNRAQGMISFGVHDRNHPIAEFYPADRAYRAVSTVGFRTFIKINNKIFYEPFQYSPEGQDAIMRITSYDLALETERYPLSVMVKYFTLPGMPFAALVRTVTLKNISRRPLDVEVLDGLPRIIPFGSRDLFLKNLSRTLEAWMYSDIKKGMAVFKLLVDPKDVAQTKYVEGANFNCAFFGENSPVYPEFVVDPGKVFGMDTSLRNPVEFVKKNFKVSSRQITCGRTPCAFSFFRWHLKGGEEKTFYSLFGGVFNTAMLKDVLSSASARFIAEKDRENKELIEEIKDHAMCLSSSETFNHYLKNTYLDNVLRGGYPFSLNNHRVYYIYSRKHGDLERDYNKFKIFASFFSEGDTNYRDVNQNRRIDLFFNPAIGKDSVVYFMNLLKMDGYNPLVVKGQKLYFEDTKVIENILDEFAPSIKDKGDFVNLMHNGFYLGELFIMFADKEVKVKNREKLLERVLEGARRRAVASFKDGCWIDHWRYNLDLIESFLYFYPDKEEELFFDTPFTFWDDEYRVKERWQRYMFKDGRLQQIGSVEEVPEKKRALAERDDKGKNFLRIGKEIYTTNLFVKLFIVILNKLATFDPDGVGIEMEADKPGWCDSLNGLPALFGSSLCETVELKRAALMYLSAVENVGGDRDIELPEEVFNFYHGLAGLLKDYVSSSSSSSRKDYIWWDKANTLKESFRRNTFWGLNGKMRKVRLSRISVFLKGVIKKTDRAVRRAYDKKTGLYYTYFFYDIDDFRKSRDGFIMPLSFKRRNLPLFLEGMVHLLRTEGKYQIVRNMRKSPLFDRRLKMYRLNLSLEDEPLAIGRSRVFPRGWLENESVWLHMEYKYLLELLKNGYYDDFYRDFYNCLVCFFDPRTYGRNVLENSSFIVSSVYPDSSLWGKGFVARLTGATVELLNIWMIMALGHKPFFLGRDNELYFRPRPIIKGELFTTIPSKINFDGEDILIPQNAWAFKMFSTILVVYHNPSRKDTFDMKVHRIIVQGHNRVSIVNSDMVGSPLSYEIRDKRVRRIDIYLGR